MTRIDVALLAFRTMALWLGASALSTLVAVPWMGPSERAALDAFAVTIGAIPVLVAGGAIWLIAPAADLSSSWRRRARAPARARRRPSGSSRP